MLANCPNCAMSLSFDDDRLPTEPFNVLCPRCRQSVTIMPPPKEEPKLPGTAAKMDAVVTGVAPAAASSDPLHALADLLIANLKKQGGNETAIETERRKMLFCIDDAQLREKLRDALDPRYYEICSANTAPEAIETFHETRAEVIILSPSFEAHNQGCGAVMQYINSLTPQVRRRTYVVLVSTQVRTLDGYTAFANGVNLTLHAADVAAFQSIFERSVREFNELYRPYNLATATTPL